VPSFPFLRSGRSGGCIYLLIFPITPPIITNTTASVRNTTSMTTSVRNGFLIGAVLPFLAFTRYYHCQYWMGYIAITGGRGETLHCAIVWAMTGWGGVPKQRVRVNPGVFAKNSIDSCTKAQTQNNILYRPIIRSGRSGGTQTRARCLWMYLFIYFPNHCPHNN